MDWGNYGKWNIWGRLRPEKDEKQPETAEGMRKRIQEYARDDAMVRSVLEAGRWNGLSGDDTMTMLAYYALLEREKFREMVLEQTMLDPPPVIIPTTDTSVSPLQTQSSPNQP